MPSRIEAMTASYNTPADTVAIWTGEKYVPSIERCIEELGREKVEALFKLRLIRLNVLSNAARPLTDAMIETMVPPLINTITTVCETTFTLADVRIVFDRAERGYYGKMYGGYGIADITSWFMTYDREKCEAIDAYEIRRKDAEVSMSIADRVRGERLSFRDAQAWYLQEQAKKNTNLQNLQHHD